MALADVLATIRREAEEEAERLIARARESAAEIERRARDEAEAQAEAMRADTDREAEARRTRRVVQARREATRAWRAAREDRFQELLAEVRTRLAAARDDPAYPTWFAALRDEAERALPDPARVRIDPRDAALAPDDDAVLETWGGVEREAADGRLLRNTFEERLARAEPELRRIAGRAWGSA